MARHAIALPWLESALADATPGPWAGPARPDLEWLAGRGALHPRWERGWRSWLLAAAGLDPQLLRGLPAGPCIRSLGTGAAPHGHWFCATPVHLLTGLDHLRLAPSTHCELGADEAAALAASLRPAFAAAGLELHLQPGLDWLVASAAPLDAGTTEPADAVGCDLRDVLPSGPDGRRLRALGNELQMLLHEHPVNLARARRGQPAVNSLWFWGVGALDEPPPAARAADGALPALVADDAWLVGAWRLLGGTAEWRADPWRAFATGGCVASATRPLPAGADEAVARACRELRESLVAGGLDGLELLLGTRPVTLARAARWRFWRRPRPLAELLT